MYRNYMAFSGLLICLLLSMIATQKILPDAEANPLQPVTAEENDYVFLRSWGGEGSEFGSPSDIAVGPHGKIFSVNARLNRITVISQGERSYHNWGEAGDGPGQFKHPRGIAVDKNGFVYVADTSNSRIQKFSNEGRFITQWDKGLSAPVSIAISGNGYFYVADSFRDKILKFSSNGAVLAVWSTCAMDFFGDYPRDINIAADETSNVYVIDSWCSTIRKHDGTGALVDEKDIDARDIAIDNDGNLLLAKISDHVIQKISTDGSFISQFGSEGEEDGELYWPNIVALDYSGNIYVAEDDRNRIQKFNNQGTYLTRWGSIGSKPGQFHRPNGIAVSSNGDIYVADSGNFRVQRFNQDGSYLAKWGSSGTEDGKFRGLTDIAIAGNGDIFVTDSGNERVQHFSKDGIFLSAWDNAFIDPSGITIDDDNYIYITDRKSDTVRKFESNGTYVTSWPGNFEHEDDQFDFISFKPGIATNTTGQVYVTDFWDNMVHQFNNEGSDYSRFGGAEVTFRAPEGIAVDDMDNVYIAVTGDHHIEKFGSDGNPIASWGNEGSGAGEFFTPRGIAVDNNGAVYIADTGNSRIQKFAIGHPTQDTHSGLLQNGSFEASDLLSSWTVAGDLPITRNRNAAHGSSALQLGSPVNQTEQDISEAWVHQTIYIRPEWSKPTLYFSYRMFVNDIRDYSDFFVVIQDGVGLNHLQTVLRDGYPGQTAPLPGEDMGWREKRFDLSHYKGQHIRIVFSNRNLWPSSWGIWTYVDDVRVVEADDLPPLQTMYLPISLAKTGNRTLAKDFSRPLRLPIP